MEEKKIDRTRQETPNLWRKYLLYTAGILGVVALLILLFNLVIMPWYVGLGNFVRVPNVISKDIVEATKVIEAQGLYVQISGEYYNKDIPEGKIISQLPYPQSQVKEGRRIYLTVSKGRETLRMPSLWGMTLREARIKLMKSGLELADIDYSHNDSAKANVIFSQSIRSETPVSSGQKVNVTISLGPEVVYITMPDLIGLPLETGEQKLMEAGLVLGMISTVKSETFMPNTVVEQLPPAGDSVATGTRINITISR